MKLSKKELYALVQEELDNVLRERKLKEHRGKPCSEKVGKEKRECEAEAEEAIERSQEKHRKKREYSANEEELEALGRGKVYRSRPKLKLRKRDVVPKLDEKNKKSKRKQCSSRADGRGHNRYHDSDGRFTSKTSATSTSIRSGKVGNCIYSGQAQMPGEKITKIPCGRLNSTNPNKKATWRCKDKTKYWEKPLRELLSQDDDNYIEADDWVFIKKDVFDEIVMDRVRDLIFQAEQSVEAEAPLMSESLATPEQIQKCNRLGLRSYEQFLNAINSLQLAQSGKLYDEPKKK